MGRRNKGAIELSVGTIVIIVLAMMMLMGGILLIRNIFSSSTNVVDITDQKVRDEISKLFTEDKRTVVYLGNKKAEIEQNEEWGVAFAVKNLAKGTAESGKFKYEVKVSDPNVKKKCGVGEREIEDWIVTGGADDFGLPPGETFFGLVRFRIPELAPMCIVRFDLEVRKDNEIYATDFFDIEVIG